MNLLSRWQLAEALDLLKELIEYESIRYYPNVKFINKAALYNHMRAAQCIEELLDIIEPYIPFRLTEENFRTFVEAIGNFTKAEENMYDAGNAILHSCFASKAKQDFIAEIQKSTAWEHWQRITAECEAIREIKEILGE